MTPERQEKFVQVLNKRQNGLTVVLENVHDPHNVSAVLRSCDAVGVREVFVINTVKPYPKKWGKRSSSSARKWVEVHQFSSVAECLERVKSRYKHIYSTHLSDESRSLYELNLTESVALLFGNEQMGLSDEIREYSDGNFIIPQVGMIKSLNISVACAISLYEAFRQRQEKGLYDSPTLAKPDYEQLYQSWVERDLHRNKSS